MTSVVVGTAGHIDHGKSALVRALTGTDPDRLKEEQARGITIDLGFAHAAVDGVDVAFVDVPGHERFVKNMLAGVGGIDLVVLVVAADESVMPQTREHFDICRLLQIPAGLVALTKADLVDADTLELARLEVRDLTAGSFLEGAPIVAVSSKTGAGLDDLRRALVEASATVAERGGGSVARLPIDRVFSMKGFGTVVTGTLVSGAVSVDDELALLPADAVTGERRTVKVRGVQVHGRKQTRVGAGHRTAVNVSGVDVPDVSRGQSLVTPGTFEPTRLADALVEVLPGAKPLKHGQRVRFHQGTAEILGRASVIGPTGSAIEPAGRGYVRLRLEAPAVVARGDRYILRAYSPPVTIAGGTILDPQPPRTAIRTAVAVDRLRRLERDPLGAMIDDAGALALPIAALVTRAGVDPRGVDARIAALVDAKQAERAGDRLVAPAVLGRARDAIVAALTELHKSAPLSDGMPRDELRERVLRKGHVAVFDRALADLEQAGTVLVRDRVALATHKVSLSPEEDRVRDAIDRAYRAGGLKPPEASAIAADTGVAPAVVDRVLKLLQRQKVLVRVDTLLFHDEALKQLKAEVVSIKARSGEAARIDVATFKERFGVTRKFAIPLLE
ncbi:MAG TPA: selenocysteine-specific translation elongation factor, partial [Vicinamibacterales bacterium]|nr:selenocysteine-specific translation elongation factor [Vicinamibacterales bacterium]